MSGIELLSNSMLSEDNGIANYVIIRSLLGFFSAPDQGGDRRPPVCTDRVRIER